MALKARYLVVLCVSALLADAPAATAQTPQSAPQTASSSPLPFENVSGCLLFKSNQWRLEFVPESRSWKFNGQVEIDCQQFKFFADEIEVFTDTNRLVARGNV